MAEKACPYCGQKIPEGDSARIWKKIHAKEMESAEKARKEQEKELGRRLKEKQAELEKRYARDLFQKVRAEKDKLEPQIRKEVEKKYGGLRQEYEALSQQLEKVRKERDKMYERGKEEARFEYLKESNQLRSKIEELNRKMERISSEERGAKSEEEVFAELKRCFPDDNFERIGKGKEGGDIVQSVMFNGKECGKIVYEIKNVQNWLNSFLKRAKEYRQMYRTGNIIIATTAFPGKEKNFCVKDGICIVSHGSLSFIAQIIRKGIVDMEKLKLGEDEKELKMQLLYDYLKGDEFKQKLSGIIDQIALLEEVLKKEEDYHNKKWETEREAQRKIREDANKIEAKVEGLIVSSSVHVMRATTKKKKKVAMM